MFIFRNLFNIPPDSPPFDSPPIKHEKKNIHEVLEQSKNWPKVSKQQFAMRFLKAHINYTIYEGHNSKESILYWKALLQLWLQEKALLIPLQIPNAYFEELVQILESYFTQIDYNFAEDILKTVQKELHLRGYAYTCLGYRGGTYNQGHAIPLRIDYQRFSKTLTVHFLNLGEGADLNPELEWDSHYPRYHFRSFPITFAESKFFGREGIDLFQRQITLRRKSGKFNAYSANDVYSAFYAVGTASATFGEDLNLRSRLPQVSYTCADLAVELVIRDFFISKGIENKELSRLFCKEKIYTLLSFSLEKKESYDDRIMLQKGLQQFALSALKKGEKSLHAHELDFCNDVVNLLSEHVFEQPLPIREDIIHLKTHFDLIERKPLVEFFEIPPLKKIHFLQKVNSAHSLDSLEKLCEKAFEIGNSSLPFHKKSILMHSLYVEADKQIRQKYKELKGFSPPFVLHYSKLQFPFLPRGEDSDCWKEICGYFATITGEHKTVLFAFHEPSFKRSIRKGIRKLTENNESTDPTASYLKFLAQFGKPKDYPLLWEKGLPTDFYYYQYLAQMCWSLYMGGTIVKLGEPLCTVEVDIKKDCYISYQITDLNTKYGLAFYSELILGKQENSLDAHKFLNENQAYCAPANLLKKQWSRLSIYSALQITSVMQWTLQNLDLVKDFAVQSQIEKKFFSADAMLIQRLQENSSLKDTLRCFAKKGLDYHLKNLAELLFFIRLGIAFETHIEKAGFQKDKGSLKHYEGLLLSQMIERKNFGRVYAHLLFLYSVDLPSQDRSLKEWVKGGFWLRYHLDDNAVPKWLMDEIYYPEKIPEHLWDSENRLHAELLDLFLLDHSLPYSFSTKWLIYRKADEILVPGSLWQTKDGYETKEGFCRFVEKEEGFCHYKKFTIEGKNYFCRQIESPNPRFVCLFEKSKSELIATDEKGQTPWALISNGEIKKIGTGGKIHPLRLANTQETIFFSRLGIPDHTVLCWINQEDYIHSLEFLSLKLTFRGAKQDSRWLLFSMDYPGFFVASDQTLDALPTFKGALILENAASEKIVLIAAHTLKCQDCNFSSKVFVTLQKLSIENPYFLYRTESLHAENPEGQLFLVLLFASHRNFKEALHILKKWSCNHYCTEFFQSFSYLSDESPEGLAFSLHLGIAFFKNQSQILQKTFSQDPLELNTPFCKWLINCYTLYLRHASPKFSHIPKYIRLNPSEELFLLKALQGATDPFPYLLNVRKSLVDLGEIEFKKIPRKYRLFSQVPPSFPLNFNPLPPEKEFNPYFVRMTLQEIQNHFVELYARAKTGLYILDLFYLSRSAHGDDHQEILAYAYLLSQIQKHPDQFPFTFSEHENPSDVFFNIVQKGKTLDKAIFFSKTLTFAFTHKKILSLPEQPKLSLLKWEFNEGVSEELVEFHLSIEKEILETKNLEDLLRKKRIEQCVLKNEIAMQANHVPPNLFHLNLQKVGRNVPEITLEGIINKAILEQKLNLLRQANPSLSESAIKEIIVKALRYHILCCHITFLTKVPKDLKVYGAFDPIEYPEFLIFQSQTGMQAKKSQAALLQWLQNKTHCLFELEAGGGKGTFLTPFLQKQAKKRGLTAISISPPGLYKVDLKKQQVILKKGFGMSLQVLEIALKTEARAEDYKLVFEKLTEYVVSDSLKIIPEVYYALDLKYQLALESGDSEKVRYLSLILNLFEEKCLALIDEARVNLSPLCQSKIGIGKKHSIPSCDIQLFIEIYKILAGPLADLAQIRHNKQAMMSGSEKDKVRLILIEKTAELPFLAIPAEEQKGVREWWQNKEAIKSKWLASEERKKTTKARAIFLARHYFLHFYDFAMQAVGSMSHQTSAEEIEMPAHRRKPSEAYFEEPYIALILTIQGALQRNPQIDLETLFHHLENEVLTKLTFSSKQLVVTPQKLLHGFKEATVYSAYLGPQEIYGPFKHSNLNLQFVDEVIDQLTQERNSQMIKVPSFATPLELFLSLWRQDPGLFDHLGMLIDVGGMFRDFESAQIARDFFAFLKNSEVDLCYDGVVFFHEDELMISFLGSDERIILPEGDLVEGLKVLGYNWAELSLMILVDPIHSIGFHALLKKQAKAFFCIGELLSIGDLIQGAMRLRDLFEKQSLVWILEKKLSAQIEEEMQCACTPKAVIQWAKNNEDKVQEKELILSAHQQIEYLLQKPARRALKSKLQQPLEQINLWKKYRRGFVKTFINDPLVRFGQKECVEKIATVLVRFAQEEYQKYDYRTPWRDAKVLHAQIKELIVTFQKKVKFISKYQVFGQEMQLYCQEELLEEQQTVRIQGLSPEKMVPVKKDFTPLELLTADFSIPARTLFKTPFFTHNLFLSHSYLNTAKVGSLSLKHKYLKPVLYFLVISEQQKLFACALSDLEADFFQKQLVSSKSPLHYALFTADGTLAQNGLSEEMLPRIISCEWFEDVVSDLALLSGTLIKSDAMVLRMNQCENFEQLWEEIKDAQPKD